MNAETSLRSLIANLLFLEIWHVGAGPSTGSVITMEIGGKRTLKVPLTNPQVTEERRLFEGEFGLFVECPWRVTTKTALVCSWSDDSAVDGPMVAGLNNSLIGSRIESVDVAPVTMDLALHLSNGTSFTLFCDAANSDDDNYSVIHHNYIHIVGPAGKVGREARSDDVRPALRVL